MFCLHFVHALCAAWQQGVLGTARTSSTVSQSHVDTGSLSSQCCLCDCLWDGEGGLCIEEVVSYGGGGLLWGTTIFGAHAVETGDHQERLHTLIVSVALAQWKSGECFFPCKITMVCALLTETGMFVCAFSGVYVCVRACVCVCAYVHQHIFPYSQEESGERLGDDRHLSGLLPSHGSVPFLPGGLPLETCGPTAAEQRGKWGGGGWLGGAGKRAPQVGLEEG